MYKNILVATDLSPRSQSGLKKAIQFAHIFNSNIYLLNVHEEFLNKKEMVTSRVNIEKLQNIYEHNSLQSKQKIHEWVNLNDENNFNVKVLLREGKASEEILTTASEFNCDLIIVGANGKTGISDYIMGTTTENIVNKSKIPVLVIPNI